MKIILKAILTLLPVILSAQQPKNKVEKEPAPKKLELLETVDGQKFKSVTIREVTPAGIKIFHSSGAATIDYEQLPKDVQRAFGGFDKEKAEKFRGKTRASQQAWAKAAEKAEREKEKEKQQARQKEVKNALKRPTAGLVKQMLDGSALCQISFKVKREVQKRTPRPLGGFDVTTVEKWVWDPPIHHLDEVGVWYHVKGLPDNLVDGSSWKGWTIPTGTYKYTSTTGARKTVKQLTIVSPLDDE